MKKIGTLAIIVAKRKNVLLQVLDGRVAIHMGYGPDKTAIYADWNDDEKINELIYELNFGKYSGDISMAIA